MRQTRFADVPSHPRAKKCRARRSGLWWSGVATGMRLALATTPQSTLRFLFRQAFLQRCQLVLQLPSLVVGEHLFLLVVLDLLFDVLDLLLRVLGAELLLRLEIDFVPRAVVNILHCLVPH